VGGESACGEPAAALRHFSVGLICFAFIWLGQPQAIDLMTLAALR
jgi:hypothetical protein